MSIQIKGSKGLQGIKQLRSVFKRSAVHNTYRLVFMNDETFEEVASIRLTPLNVYVAASSILVALLTLVVCLIVFTPLKRYIPGYSAVGDRREVTKLSQKLDELEKQLIAQREYSDNVKKILVGEVDPNIGSKHRISVTPMKEVKPSKEELLLRKEIAEIQLFGNNEAIQKTSQKKMSKIEELYFTPPLNGQVSAMFATDKNHFGIDIIAPKNTPVKAVMDGYVVSADWSIETGNTICIQHANNVISFYKHNSALLKTQGSFVKAGEAV
ncbi:MAG: peptidoglycan DD-metalloendopeptidase family protein, partial [Saprospiraceae bacterium]